MSIYVSDNSNEYKNTIPVLCESCDLLTNHKIHHSISYSNVEEIDEYTIDYHKDNQIIECLGCSNIHFRALEYGSELYDNDRPYQNIVIFPKHALKTKYFQNIPQYLDSIYIETITAFNNKLNTLCAIGVRTCIEYFYHSITNLNLNDKLPQKINTLCNQGYILATEKEFLDGIRLIGNDGAHTPATKINESQLKDSIRLIENIFERKFTLSNLKLHAKQKQFNRL